MMIVNLKEVGLLLAAVAVAGVALGQERPAGAYVVPARVDINSGIPLGGIGTGTLELRADGYFHNWTIFNNGGWAGKRPASQAGVRPDVGPGRYKFFLGVADPADFSRTVAIRSLGLRGDQTDLYRQAYIKNVQGIDFETWYPVTRLHYRDDALPVKVSAEAFSPFIPYDSRASGTPGMHMVFEIKNTSDRPQKVALAAVLDNPLAWTEKARELSNSLVSHGDTTYLTMRTDAQPTNKTTIGSLCLSMTGGQPSWNSGMFDVYARSSWCSSGWLFDKEAVYLSWSQELREKLQLSNTDGCADPSQYFRCTDQQIDQMPIEDVRGWIARLKGDALVTRVADELDRTDPAILKTDVGLRGFLKDVSHRLTVLAGKQRERSLWGTGALCSTMTLAPGETKEVRFTLSWFFPHHISMHEREMGHNYVNWFADAEAVNQYLTSNYKQHRSKTEVFARTLADTTLGGDMAFCWSSQLATLVRSSWWDKDGAFAIWEGIGCCGLSTMDINYQGTFPLLALFPDIELGQIERLASFQKPNGQVPHSYYQDTAKVDEGWFRVDMNPQFVMMIARDYLWTHDQGFLKRMWPHVLNAMKFTGSLDSDADGLPDTDCGVQTYDQWHMSGSPSYIGSLWIGALNAGVRLADEMKDTAQRDQWQALLAKATATFDRRQWNGEYYNLWVSTNQVSELCMSDQISGEWFTRLIGLPAVLAPDHVQSAVSAVLKYNFTPEQGLLNAANPPGRRQMMVRHNYQVPACWTGIEYAFASLLMDLGRYKEGQQIVASIHDRYVRSGREWNHIECSDYYARALSSWATLLAATGFKIDVPKGILTVAPTVPAGDFQAPWVSTTGYGVLKRQGRKLQLACVEGKLELKALRINGNPQGPVVAELDGRKLGAEMSREDGLMVLRFKKPLVLTGGQSLDIGSPR